jgi:hypothetical protein
LVSSYITQIDESLLLFPSESNDQPYASTSFEIFLDQIPIPPEPSQSCKPIENDINLPLPSVSNIPCDQLVKIHPWDLNRYKPLKLPLSFMIYLPKFSNIFPHSMEKMILQQKSTWKPLNIS